MSYRLTMEWARGTPEDEIKKRESDHTRTLTNLMLGYMGSNQSILSSRYIAQPKF